jgi:methylamine--corrinoid protein Co-methyltransferase
MDLLEITARANSGSLMDEDSFLLDRVYKTAKEMTSKYSIVYDPDTPVPSDDDLADRVYQAGLEFAVEVGVFCPDTGRVIKFSKDEAEEAIKTSPDFCMMGEGDDRHKWIPRKPDSNIKPWFHVGNGIEVSSEQILYNLVRGYADIKQCNSVAVHALGEIDGYPIQSGEPSEILGSIKAVEIARKALIDGGRPGLAIANGISTAGTTLATVAASHGNFGLRSSDGWLVGQFAEMKVDMATLNKASFLQSIGANIGNEAAPMIGGFAGGPAEVAVVNVAYHILGRLLFNCDYHLTWPMDLQKTCTTTRSVIWADSVCGQALSRNTKELIFCNSYAAAGPMTKQFFYEAAANVVTDISSGFQLETTHPGNAIHTDYVTPMDRRGVVETIEGCVGMTRKEANEIVKQLLLKYENNLTDAPMGKKYQECYDMETNTPLQEYVDLYGEVKKELESLGIKYRS